MTSQLGDITRIMVVVVVAILLMSFLTYLYNKVRTKDLSDQTGWRNFAKPFIGVALMLASFTIIAIIVLSLFGISV